MSQNLSTTSWMVFSQMPCKYYFKKNRKAIYSTENNRVVPEATLVENYRYLVAKSLNARGSVRQNIRRIYWEARLVHAHSAASLAGVADCE